MVFLLNQEIKKILRIYLNNFTIYIQVHFLNPQKVKIRNFSNIYQNLLANIGINMFPREKDTRKKLNLQWKISQIMNKKKRIKRSKKKKSLKKQRNGLRLNKRKLKVKNKIILIKQLRLILLKKKSQNHKINLVFLNNLKKIKLNLNFNQNLLKNLMIMKII